MDFGQMKDGLKDQMSEKVQEELTKKLNEVTTDVKARFGVGGQPGEKATSPSTSPEPTGNAAEVEPGTPPESESEVDETADEKERPIAVAETEADQHSGDAGNEEEAA